MIINHNISALNTYRQLTNVNSATQKSLEKLSSGLRINRAGDDAAGLAISEKMRGQIRGLQMASKNAQDGISLIQTAEGALNETHSILQKMRELAVQAASDTNTADDRAEIQKEIEQLVAEVNRIGETTEFNTKKLLNGGAGLEVNFDSQTVGTTEINWISITGGTAETKTGDDIEITGASAAQGATVTISNVASGGAGGSFSINGYTLRFDDAGSRSGNAAAIAAVINANSDKVGATARASGNNVTITTTAVGSAAKLEISAASGVIVSGTTQFTQIEFGTDASITSSDLGSVYIARGNTITITAGDYKGLELQLNGNIMNASGNNTAQFDILSNGVLALQIGANESQTMNISISDMRAAALGINNLDVTSQTSAGSAITTIDNAIKQVSAERSKLGSYQNRLEHTIANLGTAAENLTAAESRIRDVDMAKEIMEFTKNNIISQAAAAMLAQANAQPQLVLQLLR
jgi:flagellin